MRVAVDFLSVVSLPLNCHQQLIEVLLPFSQISNGSKLISKKKITPVDKISILSNLIA
jgi:hypothetical protein